MSETGLGWLQNKNKLVSKRLGKGNLRYHLILINKEIGYLATKLGKTVIAKRLSQEKMATSRTTTKLILPISCQIDVTNVMFGVKTNPVGVHGRCCKGPRIGLEDVFAEHRLPVLVQWSKRAQVLLAHQQHSGETLGFLLTNIPKVIATKYWCISIT